MEKGYNFSKKVTNIINKFDGIIYLLSETYYIIWKNCSYCENIDKFKREFADNQIKEFECYINILRPMVESFSEKNKPKKTKGKKC